MSFQVPTYHGPASLATEGHGAHAPVPAHGTTLAAIKSMARPIMAAAVIAFSGGAQGTLDRVNEFGSAAGAVHMYSDGATGNKLDMPVSFSQATTVAARAATTVGHTAGGSTPA